VRLSGSAALYGALSAQWAQKNLDSSEKFGIGGPQGVRAYPSGEASGDEGWLLNIEWRQELDSKFRLVGFIDYGEVTLHRTPWANWNAANPMLVNHYALAGAGATVVWTPAAGQTVSATLASRIGKNPARDVTGRDSDNRPARMQFWLQGSIAF
jgi:hemolysin activation/secretion protein